MSEADNLPLRWVLFIVNPIFGINRKPDKIIRWIHEIWQSSGIDYEIVKTAHRGHGTDLAQEAARAGVDMVVVAGGDGTINEVGRGLMGSETALGIIPAGSGNGFARNIKMPLNQRKAITALLHPVFKRFDVGKINDHYFFNIAGIGIDATISTQFENSTMRGPLPYFFLAFREFFSYTPQPVVIHVDGKVIHRKPILLSFANLPEFGVNAIIAPRAKPDDGLIDLCILNPLSTTKAVLNLHKLFNGTVDEVSEVEIIQTSKAVITRKQPGPIHTDGDPHLEDATLTVEVLPRKLRIALKDPAAG